MARTTDKRERILEYITQFTRENGYSPSVREICALAGRQNRKEHDESGQCRRQDRAGLLRKNRNPFQTREQQGNRSRCRRAGKKP